MGRNLTKTCNVCFKSMRGNNLKRHMKKHDVKTEDDVVNKELHDGKTEDNVVTKGLHDGKTEDNVETNGQQIGYTSEKFIAVQKRVFPNLEEFNRKMELGRYVKIVVDKHGLNENGLDNDLKDALKI